MRNGQPGKRLFIPRLYFAPSQWLSVSCGMGDQGNDCSFPGYTLHRPNGFQPHAEWATRETTVHSPALISKLPIPPTELQFSTGGTCTTVAPSSSTWLADPNTSCSSPLASSQCRQSRSSLTRPSSSVPMLLQLLAFATGNIDVASALGVRSWQHCSLFGLLGCWQPYSLASLLRFCTN